MIDGYEMDMRYEESWGHQYSCAPMGGHNYYYGLCRKNKFNMAKAANTKKSASKAQPANVGAGEGDSLLKEFNAQLH